MARTGLNYLQECIFYNEFNFLRACSLADPFDRGTLTYDELAKVLRSTRYQFTEKIIDDIFKDSPRSIGGETKYKELSKKIESMGMPTTFYTLLPRKENPSRIEDANKIFDPKASIAMLLKADELENFGLGRVNLKVLQDKEAERKETDGNVADTFDIHNSNVLINNFPIYLSQSMVTAALKGRVELPDSVKQEYMYQLLNRKSIEKFTNVSG